MTLAQLPTPALILDTERLDANLRRMRARLAGAGRRAVLRPHLKTLKSVEAALHVTGGTDAPITVSTLKEAEVFAAAGYRDILYAVGIAPSKLDRIARLRRTGVDLAIVVDSVAGAQAIADAARSMGERFAVLIEIDSDGHRSGVRPDDAGLIGHIAQSVSAGGAEMRGVMTHAGGSYDARDPASLAQAATGERDAALQAAAILRGAGFAAPVVSIGSTPTALSATDLTDVTEVRAGVFTTFDLVMAGIGVCTIDDIALSVLATVIGHRRDRGWIVVDAGWMAMSRDRGTENQAVDQGYGVVTDLVGIPYLDLVMASANQEHGILALRPGSAATLPLLDLGTRIRILPNHACATAAQHDRYHLIAGSEPAVKGSWSRFCGW